MDEPSSTPPASASPTSPPTPPASAAAPAPAPAPAPAASPRPAWLRVASRLPATIVHVVVLLAVGAIGQGLWSSFADHSWYDTVAYGLPALADGRWWTPVTGTFFVVEPWVYVPTLLSFAGMAYLEWRRGWRRALGVFWLGHLVAVLATSLIVWAFQATGWAWMVTLAATLDVGPSGGTMACIAAAVGLFAAPWRQRAWILVFLYAILSLLFLGTLADVEHAVAILLILAIDRSFRIQRTTVREQRMLAVATMIALGVISIIVLLVPTNGPFGQTNPEPASFVDVLIDLVVIAVAVVGLRIGRRWAWLLSLLLVVWNLLGAAVVTLVLVIAPEELAPVIGDAEVALASAVLWLLFGIFLISTRNAFRLWRAKPLAAGSTPVTADEVRALLHEQGGGTLSWMTTWDRMNYLRTSGGIVPFQTHGGVAIVLADPLGASDTRAESAREFIRAAEQRALTPCFFSASAATKDAMPPGWRSLVIADDTLVDLEGLEFKGKAWSKVRQSFSRADREGMSFRLTRLGAEPFAVRAQLQAISEQWVGEKGLPEMRFTLGTLEEAADPEVRLALALDAQGNVDGMLSWLPVYGPAGEGAAGGDGPDAVVDVAEVDSADAVVGDRGDGDAADTAAAAADTADVDAVTGAAPPRPIGWTLDVMRRRDGGFPAVMEYLIGQSAKAFGEEGAQTVSLSGAPLANEGGGGHDGDRGVIVDLLDRLGESLEPVYGFRSLHRFKKKFNPRYEPIYLLYRDEGDLPAIGSGLTRAFLPDASLAQFAAAGLELARGTRE